MAKEITVINEWKSDRTVNNCNKSLLHTLLFNILSNAIKYNKPNGKIYITAEESGSHFEIKIKDTGAGIEEDQLPFIFERFKRFRPADEMSYGLGLPIVKSVADFHNIEITAESEPGIGTTFILTFPTNWYVEV